jgi:hypothetical protein
VHINSFITSGGTSRMASQILRIPLNKGASFVPEQVAEASPMPRS